MIVLKTLYLFHYQDKNKLVKSRLISSVNPSSALFKFRRLFKGCKVLAFDLAPIVPIVLKA
jgi:hypothetical protein